MAYNYRVAEARQLVGLSQKQLADKLGVSQQAVYYYETGRSDIKASILAKISKLTGCTVSYILGVSDEPYETAVPSIEYDGGDARLAAIVDAYESMDENGRQRLAEYADMLLPRYTGETAEACVERTA